MRLLFEVALHVRKETDDRGSFFQAALELGNQRQRLCISIVQVEDDQRRFFFAVLLHALEQIFVGLHELDLDIHLACCLLDLGQEEQIVDESQVYGELFENAVLNAMDFSVPEGDHLGAERIAGEGQMPRVEEEADAVACRRHQAVDFGLALDDRSHMVMIDQADAAPRQMLRKLGQPGAKGVPVPVGELRPA